MLTEADRRHEVMRRHIHQYLMQENHCGLSHQEQYMLNHMIKELHQETFESSFHISHTESH